ncbi:MAG: chalcone isomerase family protein [Silvibacterium sp.]|nr:chalcone isomerase family protein [Silvibacterium sp.]
MRKTTLAFALAALLLFAVDVHPATLNGITMPDTVQARGIPLVLNGMGLRTRFGFKIYVAGLYLQQKSADPDAIINSDAPKRILMQFTRGVSKSQMTEAFNHGFDNSPPGARDALKAEIDRFLGQLDTVHEGDQMMFTYLPGTDTNFLMNGGEKLAIPGLPFGRLLFSVWLGPRPAAPEVKKGLLGQ